MKESLHIACLQFDCKTGCIEHNNRTADGLIKQAIDSGAELVVLPELFNTGYDLDGIPDLDYDFNVHLEWLQNTAVENNCSIAAGILEKNNGNYYNTVVAVDEIGNQKVAFRKIGLFPLGKENEIFLPGNDLATFTIGSFTVGIMICFELRFPEICRYYLDAGADLVVVPAAFPLSRLDHWQVLLKARAIENQFYIGAANRIGNDDGTAFCGNSAVIDPWGTVQSRCNECDEGFAGHIISHKEIQKVRKRMPCENTRKKINLLLHEKK